VAALAERRRRHLVQTPTFEGCRCCYDPNQDGGESRGEYLLLAEYYKEHYHHPSFVGEPEEEDANQRFAEEDNNRRKDSDDSEKEDDSDDEFDYLLDEDFAPEAEETRRAQLEWEILHRQVAAQHGYGVHRPLHPVRILKAAGLSMVTPPTTTTMTTTRRPPPPAVVIHLIDPESMASASLDYFLETKLASQYPGTIFLRSNGRSTLLMNASVVQKHLPTLSSNYADDSGTTILPALIAIREGQVVNLSKGLRELCSRRGGSSSSSWSHGDEEIEPHAVEFWLEQSGVLRRHLPPYDFLCHIRPEEEALMDCMGKTPKPPPKQEQEEFFRCGVEGCCKTFFHEHVGIKTSTQDGLMLKEDTILGKGEEG